MIRSKKKKEEVKETAGKENISEKKCDYTTESNDLTDKQTADPANKDNELELLKENIVELNNKHIRLLSEFDNFKKRTLKEKADLISSASTELLLELLPIADDFDRAIKAASETTDINAVIEGLKLIHQKFNNILSKKGVEAIKSLGEKFETDYHEAITTIEAKEENQKGIIVDEIQKGYMLNDKVIRYARVVVAG